MYNFKGSYRLQDEAATEPCLLHENCYKLKHVHDEREELIVDQVVTRLRFSLLGPLSFINVNIKEIQCAVVDLDIDKLNQSIKEGRLTRRIRAGRSAALALTRAAPVHSIVSKRNL